MFALTLSKLELFFEIARKFHRHCTKTNYDIMADYCLKEIAASYESDIDHDAICRKIRLQLDNSVPRRFYFNHILFLTVIIVETNSCTCQGVCDQCAINKIFKMGDLSHCAPWGGIIGPGMTVRTHYVFSTISSILKLHAVFHDAYGHLYRTRQKGPGYNYMLPFQLLPNVFWLGHFTGFLFFFWLKIRYSTHFRYFDALLK